MPLTTNPPWRAPLRAALALAGVAAAASCGTRTPLVDDLAPVASSAPGPDAAVGPADAGRRDAAPVCGAESSACASSAACCSGRCVRGVCARSVCTPGREAVTLASASLPIFLAVDELAAYFGEGSVVMRVPLEGGRAEPLFAAAPGRRVQGVAVDEAHVYWTEGESSGYGGVGRIAKEAGATPTRYTYGGMFARAVAPAGTGAFFTGDGPSGSVSFQSFAAGEARVVLASSQTNPWAMVADEARAFWAVLDTSSVPVRSRVLAKSLGDESHPKELAALPSAPTGANVWALALDGTDLYASAGTGVFRLPRGGGPVTRLASTDDLGGGLAVDASHVYFASKGATAVSKVPKGGGVAVDLATGLDTVRDVRVDGSCVYWVESGEPGRGGRVARVPK